MYDLHLTAEQIEIRDTVRDFVRNEVRPVTLHPSRLEPFEKPLLTDLLAAASKMGLRALTVSEDSGGAGADSLTSCLVMEELAQGDPDIAVVLARTSVLAHLLFDELMTPEQRALFLPQFMDDHAFHLAYAGTDPQSGLAACYHRPRADMPPAGARAVKDGSAWVLDGEYAAVANAPIAKLFAVQADTPAGAATLLVPRDAQGVSIHAPAAPVASSGESRTIRWGHGSAGKVVLKGCRVPGTHLLGGASGAAAATAYATRIAPQLAAANIGIGQAAFEAAVDYAKLRRQGGRSIIEHQPIGTLLADIAMKLDAARGVVWKAAWAHDHPDAVGDRSVSTLPLHHMARAFTAQAIVEVTERAAECFGAMGVMRDMPLQKYVGDALVFKHAEVGHAAAKLLIAEAVAGFERTQS
jgi:alkylation response protein AidB-like acyl-CoA dehydrogenase